MKRRMIAVIAAVSMILVASCSTGTVKQPVEEEAEELTLFEVEPLDDAEGAPPSTHVRSGKTLNLVRVMEGGACKNDREGVEGLFLLYADPDDVERIKVSQGAQIFGDFEREIEAIAAAALQETIKGIYLAGDSFFPDSPTSLQNMISEFSLQFVDTIENAIDAFQRRTALTIDIVPFESSLYFYTEGCEITAVEDE